LDRRLRIARILLSIAALHLVFIPPIADLNASHVLNPLWPGHARLHTVWLITTNSLIAMASLWLLWRPPQGELQKAIRLAGTLVGAILIGFFVAGSTQGLYGGALTDVDDPGRKIVGLDPPMSDGSSSVRGGTSSSWRSTRTTSYPCASCAAPNALFARGVDRVNAPGCPV
jgi:hypothetical protein